MIKELHQALRTQHLKYPGIVTSSELYVSHKIGFVLCFISLNQNTPLILLQNTKSNIAQVING